MRSEISTFTNSSTLLIVLCLLTLSACGGSNLRRTPTSERDTPWFCQMNETRDNWECVQDAELARRPRPERLPGDEPPVPETETIPLIAPTVVFEEAAPRPGDTATSAPVAIPTVDTTSTEDVEASVETVSISDVVSTAVAVPTEHELLSLSADMFAVQLIATASEPTAADFRSSHEIDDAMVVRLANNGELFYVVLLGVYDNYTDAEHAVATRPESLAETEPWIRSLKSIQAGLREAESLIASNE